MIDLQYGPTSSGREQQRFKSRLFNYNSSRIFCYAQSTYIYRAPQCMSPRWNWDSPTPLAASECALPRTKGWGGTLACCKRGAGVPIPTTGVTLSTLPTLCCYGSYRISSSGVFPATKIPLRTVYKSDQWNGRPMFC
jgi:hypothetical protein